MSNKAITKLIVSAYDALDRLNDVSMSNYRDKIYKLAAAGERQHRRINGGAYHCSVATAAKLHTVRWLVKYVDPDTLPTVKGMLSIRADIQLAAMVAANYRDIILIALRGFDLGQLASIDYAALVENRAANT